MFYKPSLGPTQKLGPIGSRRFDVYWTQTDRQRPKFKRVSLNETPEFPFWGLHICVDFDLRDSKKMENIKKLKK